MVTTSYLSAYALDWIKRDVYRLGFWEGDELTDQIIRLAIGQAPRNGTI
ncbi:MAG: hypothetical protein PF503_25685 [Desulfobacula sp.]|nr:hypothetical protein [Desulfobacula sp.]